MTAEGQGAALAASARSRVSVWRGVSGGLLWSVSVQAGESVEVMAAAMDLAVNTASELDRQARAIGLSGVGERARGLSEDAGRAGDEQARGKRGG